jgi:hypothetical protein
MEFYYLALVLFTAVYGYGWYFGFKRRKDPLLSDALEWFGDRRKALLIGWGVGLVIITMVLVKPLWRTTVCRYYQFSYNTITKQDWMLNQCLYKTKTGAWLPLVVTRDSPDGNDQVERPVDAVETH